MRTDLHFYPRLVVDVGGRAEARMLADRLAAGEPAIVVPHAPLARGELVICPEAITVPDRPRVEQALAALASRLMGSWTLAGATVIDGTGVARRTSATS